MAISEEVSLYICMYVLIDVTLLCSMILLRSHLEHPVLIWLKYLLNYLTWKYLLHLLSKSLCTCVLCSIRTNYDVC